VSSLEPDDSQANQVGVLTMAGPDSGETALDEQPDEQAAGAPRSAATMAALVVGMMAAAVYRKGGFYPADAFGVAVVSGIVAVVALVRFKDRASAAVAFAVGGLAVWWMIRSVLAHHPAAFFPFGATLLGFLGAFVVVKALNDRDRGRVALSVVAVSALTATVGLVGVLWRIAPLAQHTNGFWQLSTPLTHPAGAAGMFAVAILLALGLDLDAPLVRVALCLMLAGLIATQSHWVLLALACGACFVPLRRWRHAPWPLACGVVAGCVVLASASSHLGSWPAALAVAAAAAAAGASAIRAGERPGPSRRGVVAAAVLLLLVVVGTTVAVVRPPGITAPTQPVDQGQTLAWSAAARAWGSSVVTGTGPKAFQASTRPVDSAIGLNPDTVLTIGTDGGIIAVVLLVGAVGAVGTTFRRRDVLASCAAGAAVAFVVCGVVDVDWQIPAVGLLGGCVAALATSAPAPSEQESDAPSPASAPARRSRMRAIAVPVALGIGVTALIVTQVSIGSSSEASGGGSVARIETDAPAPSPTPDAPARYILKGSDDVTDPFMLTWHGRYYIYTSEGTTFLNVPVRVGTKIGHWGQPIEALPKLPHWAVGGRTWAPDVHQVAGGWALYFTALLRGVSPPTHCIGSAFSSSPTGPFVPVQRPFICQLDHRGSIDARVLVDGSRLVMMWKSEDNANPDYPGPDQNGYTGIYTQYLSADGRVLLGHATKIFGPSEPWEGTIVESPDIIEAWGTYWLFFSGNWYFSPQYGIGVAACQSLFGPCTDVSPKPFIGSNEQGLGPGEESIFQEGGAVYLLYNPFRANDPGPVIPRPAVMARLGFTPDGPYLAAF
jgi:hypothetical protein